MKLKINGFENEIKFESGNIYVIEINNPKCFSNILQIINDKINGLESSEIFLLDNNDEILNMSKEMYIVFDVFNIEYNSKKILNKLYELIEKNINTNQDLQLENMMLKVRNYLIEEINELPFEFTMKQELDILEILKIFGVKIDESCYISILEKIEMLIDIIATLKIARVLIIPNLKQYLTKEELVEIYKYSLYNNINLLLIERENKEKLEYEKVLTIDKEYNDILK